ncbi:MAG: terminase large subunit [Gammaproteobacteria bacterium]|nr:terminase large subunit [Gammaproteobacteria bacterium]
MPYAKIDDRRRMAREGMRKRRAAAKASAKAQAVSKLPDDPIGELAKWSRETLVVPPGHPLAGQPMALPQFGIDFLADAITHRESLLSIARKNAKSAVIGVYLLARLAGPLRVDGYRAGVCSVNREKAGELKQQMEAIAEASGLRGVKFLRSPAPGRVESASGRVDILSADKAAGHSSGFDDALVDELGLLPERNRELVNGMRTATSARDGRFIALSIQGDSPFTREMIERRDHPGTAVHHYAAPEDCKLDDEAAWRAANPGLGSIKSLAWMRDEAARVLVSPADQASFKAFDLNLPQDPSREMICEVADWRACESDDVPERKGPCVIGFDLGGSASMTALAACWPTTHRVEVYGAFPGVPDLRTRGVADGVGRLYQRMAERGELRTYAGRVTPVSEFLGDCAAHLRGSRVVMAGADRYRKSEAMQALDDAGLNWPMQWRGQGASGTADGSHDVRAFQRAVLRREIVCAPSLMMRSAIAKSSIRRDGSGNPALQKANDRGRIDALSAAVIACGLAEVFAGRPRRTWRYRGAA